MNEDMLEKKKTLVTNMNGKGVLWKVTSQGYLIRNS